MPLISCNFNIKVDEKTDNFFLAEKEFNHYNIQKAIRYYKLCIKPIKTEKDTLVFRSYCKLAICYDKINSEKEFCLLFQIIDSLFNKKPLLHKYIYDYNIVFALHELKNHEYSESAKYYQKAIGMLAPEDTMLSYLYYKTGVCYEKQNLPKQAENYYRKALEIAKGKKDKSSYEHIIFYYAIAAIYQKKYSDFYTAGLYYDSIINKSLQCNHFDSSYFAGILFNIGYFYHYRGIYIKAEKFYSDAFNIYSKLRNSDDALMKLLYYQTYTYSYLEKFDIAKNKIDKVISYYLKINNPSGLQESYFAKAYMYFNAKEYNSAILFYKKALDINLKFRFTDTEKMFKSIAWCYLNQDIFDSAEVYFRKSMALYNNEKIKNIAALTTLYGEYSRMLIKTKRYNEALKTIDNFLPQITTTLGKHDPLYGYFIYWKALAYENLNKLQASIDIYQEVISVSINKNIKSSVFDVPDFTVTNITSHDNLIDALSGKAGALLKMAMLPENYQIKNFLLQKSLQHYEKANEVVSDYNKQIGLENDRLQFTSSKSSVSVEVINTAIQLFRFTGNLNYLEKAFNEADRYKATQVVLGLKDDEYKRLGGVPDSIMKKEKHLQEKIALLQSSINDEQNHINSNSPQVSVWRNKLLDYMNDLEKLSNRIDENYPRYHQLKYSGKDIEIDTLSHLLGLHKALAEFYFSQDSLFTFLLSGNKLDLISQSSKGIEDSLISFRNNLVKINDTDFTAKGFKNYISKAWWLYCKLIGPIEPYIANKELIIVPDAMLNLLPFDALVTSSAVPSQIDYGKLSYLLYKYPLNYAYSAELFMFQQKLKSYATDKVIAFAPEYKNITSCRINDPAKTSGSLLLSPLKGTPEESRKIVKTFGGKAILGNKATKTNFKKYSSVGSILHLAMHTIINNEYPMNSKLVFSQTDNLPDYGFLNVYEIYNLNLHSPLIVLSACNTGCGKLMKGEGIISLARGFVYAGCPSLVISLWSIADRSSSDLMCYFYKNLKKNESINKALQQAKIEYINYSDQRFSHPYFWAGFVQTGKTLPLLKKQVHNVNKFYFIILAAIVLGCIYLFYKKRLKQNKTA